MWLYLALAVASFWCAVHGIPCVYEGVMYQPGRVQLDPCVTCVCSGDTGQLTCSHKVCPPTDHPSCIRYEVAPGSCCPVCVEFGCHLNGMTYRLGERVRLGPCSYCYCPWQGEKAVTGTVICVNMTCPVVYCQEAFVPPGKCCPVCPQM